MTKSDGQPEVPSVASVYIPDDKIVDGRFLPEGHFVTNLPLVRQRLSGLAELTPSERAAVYHLMASRYRMTPEDVRATPAGEIRAMLAAATSAGEDSTPGSAVGMHADRSGAQTRERLLELIDRQKALMVSVATGGPRIQEVNGQYRKQRTEIREVLAKLSETDPNPHGDLWGWHGKWSGGDLPTYASRRAYVADLYRPLIDRIERLGDRLVPASSLEPTGWERVDRTLSKAIRAVYAADNEEDFQAVGLLCRETMISLAQAVYDPDTHTPAGGKPPSETDAKGMLEAYIKKELSGASNEAARRYAKAALVLANELQHRRSAIFRHAAMCATATAAVVELLAILAERRAPRSVDRSGDPPPTQRTVEGVRTHEQ